MASFFDELELDDETHSEQLARELAESDINLIHTLRCVREEQGLSQRQLGDRMGVSQATVSDFESGESEPKLSTVRRYAHALDVLVTHTVRPCSGEKPEGFMWVSVQAAVPASRPASELHNYRVGNSKRTDFALGA